MQRQRERTPLLPSGPQPAALLEPPWDTRFIDPSPKEKLDAPTQQELQRLGDEVTDILARHLGLSLDDVEVFMQSLAHLNDQNTGRKDALPNYSEMYREIIKPQIDTLTGLARERVHPADWTVRMPPTASLGDYMCIQFRHRERDLSIMFYERGVEIDSPEIGLNWNTNPFPRDGESKTPGRWGESYMYYYQRPDQNTGLPSLIKVVADNVVMAEGPLVFGTTDHSRAGVKPDVFELLGPKRLLTTAAYGSKGELRSLKLVFPLPGTKNRIESTFFVTYDLRGRVQTGVQPTMMRFGSKLYLNELPEMPDVRVADGKIQIAFMGTADNYPLKAPTVLEVAQSIHDVVQEKFPPTRWPKIE